MANRTLYFTDEAWTLVQRLAVALTVKEGRPVSVSEAIRRAVDALAKKVVK